MESNQYVNIKNQILMCSFYQMHGEKGQIKCLYNRNFI